jgi:galactofuranosylgalactofuranosylrhamnosyl-N-acetylglucosaminyl-diphospho-decaprenol beta-1,5/1,6-galactofuranosyltransferase
VPDVGTTRLLQRVVFPLEEDSAAAVLYFGAPDGAVIANTRTRLELRAGVHATFEAYFSAFPAGYWRAHTEVECVALLLTVVGAASVTLCGASPDEPRRVIDRRSISGQARFEVALDAHLTWLWFEVTTTTSSATICDVSWEGTDAAYPTAAVCITTFDRRDDCLGVLARLSADPLLLPALLRIVVVDQGSQRLREHPAFPQIAAGLHDRLLVVEQPNLGGSGGFSRGMLEALEAGVDSVLLLDDDVIVETESIRRMLAFAARVRQESLIGGHMLSLSDRTTLHTYGERVDERGFWWRPVAAELSELALGDASIQRTESLRRVYEVDFNGWWMCLVPASVIRRIGVALPYFIKWDDAEFGLRARESGAQTVTLPGAAIWHMPWTGKDDGLDWQAYYQLRNRLVTALLHSRAPRGGGVLAQSFAQDVNHVLCLQYGSASVRAAAVRDVLGGPAHLTHDRGPASARATLAAMGQEVVEDDRLPVRFHDGAPIAPNGCAATVGRALRVLVHQIRAPRRSRPATVERALTRAQGKWWALGLLDSATVASATGRGAFVARRDRSLAARLVGEAAASRLVLWLRWPSLARSYRAALPHLTSAEAWRVRFHGPDGGAGGG